MLKIDIFPVQQAHPFGTRLETNLVSDYIITGLNGNTN